MKHKKSSVFLPKNEFVRMFLLNKLHFCIKKVNERFGVVWKDLKRGIYELSADVVYGYV